MIDGEVSRAIINALKKEFTKKDWWPEVQEDVQTKIGWIIDHIQTMGVAFSKTYFSLFRWELERRQLEGQSSRILPGNLENTPGMRISEEAYQCGILPTRAVLDLYDFTRPNDADVTACMYLCNKIKLLKQLNLIPLEENFSTPDEDIALAFRSLARRKMPSDSIVTEEVLDWDFDHLADSE